MHKDVFLPRVKERNTRDTHKTIVYKGMNSRDIVVGPDVGSVLTIPVTGHVEGILLTWVHLVATFKKNIRQSYACNDAVCAFDQDEKKYSSVVISVEVKTSSI